ncbi:hypothetical protein FOC1_g10016535 [Fusarium oxysporum f. sp. cubense race 1]|uniref:Uncharacterized protein n=1 Tax=Fusarium oxysporum f. sp. cubense (strain race 1) TaxID=1229664 RepID=N4TEI3_FUSC1|nr:hypothetical protein FOC1_g10016535 [Fusarium oxysporum f. sp. cubense race 1]
MALTGLYVMSVFEPCDSIVVCMYPCQIICPNPLLTRDSQPQKSSLARYLGRDRTSYGVGYTELLPSVEAARVRRLKKRFAQELMAIIGYRLPLEMCENIGRYCLSKYATKLINDVWSSKDFAGPRHATLRVTKSRSIWAQHVEFEGLQLPPASVSASTSPKAACGIREVVITQDDNTPSLNQDKGLSWVVNRRKALLFSFEYKTDVSYFSILDNTGDLHLLTGFALLGSEAAWLGHN